MNTNSCPQGLVNQRISQYEQYEQKTRHEQIPNYTKQMGVKSAVQTSSAFSLTRPESDLKIDGAKSEKPVVLSKAGLIRCYRILRDKLESGQDEHGYLNKSSLFIKDENGRQEVKLARKLGNGASKIAILLENGKALLIPNLLSNSLSEMAEMRWDRMVQEETAMSQVLSSVGLLSPMSKLVEISFSAKAVEGTIPAYVSESFENLGSKMGLFILDRKNSYSSTWQSEKDSFFKHSGDQLNVENYDSIMTPLLADVVKMCIYGIPDDYDSLNLAVVKKNSGIKDGEKSKSEFEARYFGFDFSDKKAPISVPTMKKLPIDKTMEQRARDLMACFVSRIFMNEFGLTDIDPMDVAVSRLFNQLIDRYDHQVVSKLHEKP